MLQDIRYAFRMLRKGMGFTLVAVLTLALGIGANTALFSVVNGVLLNPLPYPHPEQLVALHQSKPNFSHGAISYPNFLDWQKANHSFSQMAVYRSLVFNLTGWGDAEQLFGQYVTADFFDILGTKPVLGRSFAAGEDRIGGPPLVMISAELWERKFGASADMLNKAITLNGTVYTVVGVAPKMFTLPVPYYQRADVYIPMGQFDKTALLHRDWGLGIHGIARLKPEVSFAQAEADMTAVSRALEQEYPDFDKNTSTKLIPLREQVVGSVRPYLLTLLGAVGFVLLIACVNVANLLLARSVGRTREFAIRTALGASKLRVLRQLVTESLLLSLLGGALGVLLASYGTHAALAALPGAAAGGSDPRGWESAFVHDGGQHIDGHSVGGDPGSFACRTREYQRHPEADRADAGRAAASGAERVCCRPDGAGNGAADRCRPDDPHAGLSLARGSRIPDQEHLDLRAVVPGGAEHCRARGDSAAIP